MLTISIDTSCMEQRQYSIDRHLLAEPNVLPADFALQQVEALYQEIPRQQVDFHIRELENSIHRQRRFFPDIHIANLNFQDLLGARIAGEFFSSLFPNPKRARLGMMELLVNAVEHGNLGITSEEKHTLLATGTWLAEVTRRLADDRYKHKRVHTYCYRHEDYIKLTIRDEGAGFDPGQYLDPDHQTPHNQLSGRGLALAKLLAFDEMGYTPKANAVWCLQYT